LKSEYDVVIAGAGIGGLAAAAALSKAGFTTVVLERLPRIGGRYTNVTYKGFQLTTGALHLFPHGRGATARFVKDDLQADVELMDTGPVYYMHKGSTLSHVLRLPSTIDSFLKFSIGLRFNQTPFVERLRFIRRMVTDGRPCILKGGCQSMIEAMKKIVEDYGGAILTKTALKQIVTDNSSVVEVKIAKLHGQTLTVKTRRLISDLGSKNTTQMLPEGHLKSELKHSLNRIQPTEGMKISVESNKPILTTITGEDSSLLFTPSCQRIAGIVEPSALDPNLAPPGKSLLMSYQPLATTDIASEVRLGIKDLHAVIPEFKGNCRVLAAQVFKGDWPVNRAQQGRDARGQTIIEGLYLVGDSAKPSGFIMAEGAVEGARRVANTIKKA